MSVFDEEQGTRDKGRGTRDEGQGTRDEGQGTRTFKNCKRGQETFLRHQLEKFIANENFRKVSRPLRTLVQKL